MSKVLIDRSTVEQVLEALEAGPDVDPIFAGETEDALRAALAEPDTCTWQQDGDSDSGVYGTSCGSYFSIDDGTPEDNKMKWCCYCGRKLTQALITEDEDD